MPNASPLDTLLAGFIADPASPHPPAAQKAIKVARHLQQRARALQTPAERRLRAQRLRIALVVALAEGVVVFLDLMPWWVVALLATVAVVVHLGFGRGHRRSRVRSLTWIAAVSQLVVVVVPPWNFPVGLTMSPLAEALSEPRVKLALNGTLVARDALLVTPGDELAFLPPVSGG